MISNQFLALGTLWISKLFVDFADMVQTEIASQADGYNINNWWSQLEEFIIHLFVKMYKSKIYE